MAEQRDNTHVILIDDDGVDGHHKTVFAHFGSAIFFAQCLEHGLANALVYLDLIPNHPRPVRTHDDWTKSFDGFMDKQFENTLGQLVARLRKITNVPDDLLISLTNALKTRNWLAHDYFRERAMEWLTWEAREHMIAEFEGCGTKFVEADRLLNATFKSVREKYGFTDERLRQAYDEMMLEARASKKT